MWSQLREDADANFSTLRRTALWMLKNDKTKKFGIKNYQISEGWHEHNLFKSLSSKWLMVQSPCDMSPQPDRLRHQAAVAEYQPLGNVQEHGYFVARSKRCVERP